MSVAPFYKRIDNPIFTRSYVETDYVYDDRLYERFGISHPENADEGRIAGVEFNVQSYFTRLPAPFDGLGREPQLHGRPTRRSRSSRGTDELPFFKQSDHVGNGGGAVREVRRGDAAVGLVQQPVARVGRHGAASDNYGDTYRVVDFKFSAPLRRGLRALVRGWQPQRRAPPPVRGLVAVSRAGRDLLLEPVGRARLAVPVSPLSAPRRSAPRSLAAPGAAGAGAGREPSTSS